MLNRTLFLIVSVIHCTCDLILFWINYPKCSSHKNIKHIYFRIFELHVGFCFEASIHCVSRSSRHCSSRTQLLTTLLDLTFPWGKDMKEVIPPLLSCPDRYLLCRKNFAVQTRHRISHRDSCECGCCPYAAGWLSPLTRGHLKNTDLAMKELLAVLPNESW